MIVNYFHVVEEIRSLALDNSNIVRPGGDTDGN